MATGLRMGSILHLLLVVRADTTFGPCARKAIGSTKWTGVLFNSRRDHLASFRLSPLLMDRRFLPSGFSFVLNCPAMTKSRASLCLIWVEFLRLTSVSLPMGNG